MLADINAVTWEAIGAVWLVVVVLLAIVLWQDWQVKRTKDELLHRSKQ